MWKIPTKCGHFNNKKHQLFMHSMLFVIVLVVVVVIVIWLFAALASIYLFLLLLLFLLYLLLHFMTLSPVVVSQAKLFQYTRQ